jgi:predicted metal-dependent phosphoesterase TrpH
VRDRADLHLHTTHSDGTYTPAQVLDLARRCGLAAIALTDHDTVAGWAEAQAAATPELEVIPGVELTCLWRGRGVHLLGYFFRPEDAALQARLAELRVQRRQRLYAWAEQLRRRGLLVPEEELERLARAGSVGRRHLAAWLVQSRQVASERLAFRRYLQTAERSAGLVGLRVAEAIALVRAAGGIVSLAHPPYDFSQKDLATLARQGLAAVEVEFPACPPQRRRQLRRWAAELHLAISGGSDCHGPEPWRQTVGSCTISRAELEALRRRAGA